MADLRAQRGVVFLVFSRVALLLIITAPWVYSALGFVNYISLLILSALIAWVGIQPQPNPHLDRGESLVFHGKLQLCVFNAEATDKKRESFSACEILISDQRILILETIGGQAVLLAQFRFAHTTEVDTLPALRTWADFHIERFSFHSRSLSIHVTGNNEGSAHWGTSRVDLLFPEAASCYALLQDLNAKPVDPQSSTSQPQ